MEVLMQYADVVPNTGTTLFILSTAFNNRQFESKALSSVY